MTARMLLHSLEESRTAEYPLAVWLVTTTALRETCTWLGSGRCFPFIDDAAFISPCSPLSQSTPPLCWSSCLCSCATGQIEEVILAGKKNMLLFARWFNFWGFFSRQINSQIRFAGPAQKAMLARLQDSRLSELTASTLSTLYTRGIDTAF